jgi:hypothetical protein
MCELLCCWAVSTGQRFGQMLVMVTHSYRNRSQTKTIFDLGSTIAIITFTAELFKLSQDLLFFTAALAHTFFKTWYFHKI